MISNRKDYIIMQVLIVEDEERLAQAIERILTGQKIKCDIANDGADGLDYARLCAYDLIILDVMIPRMNGFDVARQLRSEKNATPILMLTARDDVSSKVKGLDCGADDYMTKPFNHEELLARVRALTRRKGEVVVESLDFGDISLNVNTNTLSCGTKSVRLGFKEFEVLKILMSNGGSITPKETLLVKVWGSESSAEDNNAEAYVSFLRKKLSFIGSGVSIETVRKVGYRLAI